MYKKNKSSALSHHPDVDYIPIIAHPQVFFSHIKDLTALKRRDVWSLSIQGQIVNLKQQIWAKRRYKNNPSRDNKAKPLKIPPLMPRICCCGPNTMQLMNPSPISAVTRAYSSPWISQHPISIQGTHWNIISVMAAAWAVRSIHTIASQRDRDGNQAVRRLLFFPHSVSAVSLWKIKKIRAWVRSFQI